METALAIVVDAPVFEGRAVVAYREIATGITGVVLPYLKLDRLDDNPGLEINIVQVIGRKILIEFEGRYGNGMLRNAVIRDMD